MKIYTKTGDKGTTSLVGGQRVSKDDIRLNAYGTVDELNSFLGLLRAKSPDKADSDRIFSIQNKLFAVGANLATDRDTTAISPVSIVEDVDIEWLECQIDDMNNELPPLRDFIVYGEDELSALCHVCRAVARRAEREIITVNQKLTVDGNVIKYMNRLSDFLFVLARIYTKKNNGQDFFWQK